MAKISEVLVYHTQNHRRTGKNPCTLPVISKVPDIFYNFIGNVSISFDIVYDIIYDITDFLASKAKTPMISYCFVISYMISYQKV